MAKEIERKFLVREGIRESGIDEMSSDSMEIRQYYLVSSKDAAVRLRDQDDGSHPILTVKTGGNGISCDEFEFRVAHSQYEQHLADRKGIEIVKTRFIVPHGGRRWEVDVFRGDLEGLVVAELECDDAAEVTDLPDWVGEEVTYDSRYKNAVLAIRGKPQGNVRDNLQGLAARIANNRAVMDALAKLEYEHPSEQDKVSSSDGIDETVLDYMTGTDETATHELRTLTLNPFAKNIITIENPPEYLIEGYELQPYSHPVANAERQKAFEEAMSQVVRADPDQIMRADPPFHIFEKPIDGLTEGLMFAPGDAVFTEGKSAASIPAVAIADGETPEMMAALRFADALRNAGDDVVPMLNDLAESTLTFCATEDRVAVDAVKYDSDEERAAAQRLVEALRAAGVDVVSMLDDLTEHAENPSDEDEPVLLAPLSPAGIFAQAKDSDESTVEGNGSVPEEGVLLHVANSGHVVTVSPHAAGVADAYSGISDDLATKIAQVTERHRYIDQSQEIILIGEVADENSADLLERAVAEGHKVYLRKED